MKQACTVVVRRILGASQVLLDFSKIKTLKPEHLKLLAKMNPQPASSSSAARSPASASPSKKNKKGGSSDHHLPSEYYGVPSGQYTSAPSSPLDHTVYTSSPHLARHRLDATLVGGGAAATAAAGPVSQESVSACVDEYANKKGGIKVDEGAKRVIRTIVADTLSPSTTPKEAETVAIKWAKANK